MKKIIAFALAGLLLISLAACGGNEGSPANPSTPSNPDRPTETNAQPGKDAFTMLLPVDGGELPVAIGADPAPVLAALGEGDRSFEDKSCAVDAKDTTYFYKTLGIELTVTYPQQGDAYVTGILLKNDNTATAEGLRIGSPAEDITAAYGSAGEESNGHFRYRKGRSLLTLRVADGAVDQITYSYDFETE